MKKLLFFTVLVLATTASAAYTLNQFDSIVHGTLYNYGLRFSYEWADPYWTTLRIIQVLMGLAAVFAVVNAAYVYVRYIHKKPQVVLPRGEKKVISSSGALSSSLEPASPSETHRVGGLVKCAHCHRVFAQPLRMLDFHSDPPRMINICPFCNEMIPPILRHEEAEKGKKAVQKGKKNDQAKVVRELQEERQEQRTEEAEGTVAAAA